MSHSEQQPKEPASHPVDPSEADGIAVKLFWIVLGSTLAYAAAVILFIH